MPIVSEHDVRAALKRGERKLQVPADAIVTPQALEIADRFGLPVRYGEPPHPVAPGIDPARAVARTLVRRSPRWVAPPRRPGLAPTRFTRIAFVGAGMVGTTAAHLAAMSGMAAELTLIDVVPGLAASVALDIEHASGITGSRTRAKGGTSLKLVAGAEAVVVTAGRPRSPGMTRAGLLEINGRVVRDVGEAIAAHAPNAVVIVVTNPVDEMTYQLWRASGLPDEQVLGMAGTLDSSRFRNALAEAAKVSPADVSAVALGSHGAEMVPVVSTATIKGRPVREVLPEDKIQACVRDAIDGGAQVVALRKTGSAFIAPAHAVIEVLEAMRGAIADPVPVSAMVHGEYGLEGVFLGVRARLGRTGVVEIIEDRLDEAELAALGKAAASIKQRLGIATES
ncbi:MULTISPECIES: malate dehydrogenase [Thermocrispum]|jgi:malate dehydrogenase|uniref:Malate dehydrogenase n=1 Tax=Thermocrispum agreste TaxID=37925 RepID=A0ABD6FEW7_9PSEU|nr:MULTISPECIES: malate dehydrogenase [Thermocrispum]